MKNNIKISILFFILLFVYSCGTAQDALVGKKRSEQGDEFLIDKKNPLSMPPDFDKLPEPGESLVGLTNENNEDDDSEIKKLLIKNEDDELKNLSEKKKCDPKVEKCETTIVENSIIEKLK